ncbi:MAG: alpha/beta hydrolase family protein [Acidobacteriota bacterium]
MALFLYIVATAACDNSPTSPKDPVTFPTHRQIEVRVPAAGASLAAGLLLPPTEGPHPVLIMVRGSYRWTRLSYDGFTANFVDRGIAVWTYDRRGAGESTGTYDNDVNDFPFYAEDVLANVCAARSRTEIDAEKIGLYGFSQGGWIVPMATAQSDDVAFTIIASGPAVTAGEEKLYSVLAGDDDCMRSELTEEEIDRRLEEAGPSLFDPRPFIEGMTRPALRQYCTGDTSVPIRQSIAVSEEIRVSLGRDFTIQVFDGCNHNFVAGGGPCEAERLRVDWVSPMFDWLKPVLQS